MESFERQLLAITEDSEVQPSLTVTVAEIDPLVPSF